jgi:uncharacterized alkaline shock family protein YloU
MRSWQHRRRRRAHSDRARVVGAVARLAAQAVPAVSLALGGGHPSPASHQSAATNVGVAGDHVVVDLQIAVDLGAHIPAVTQQVREQITRHLHAHTGLTTTEVNITVVDVQPPPAP